MKKHTIVRTVTGIVAVLLVIGAAFFAFNASVANSFNGTAATLSKNLTALTKKNPDLDALTVSQQQVSAQLSDLTGTSPLQLPQVKQSVENAVAVSEQLDKKIAELKAQETTQSQDAALSQQNSSDSSDSDSSSNDSDEQSEEQKKQQEKLDALLKQNSTSEEDSDGSSDDDSSTTSPDSSTTKPW